MSSHIARKVVRQFRQNDLGPARDDTEGLAPRERDLWMIEPRNAADWSAYGLVAEANQAALELYRLSWDLSEICGYAVGFRAPHVEDDNTRVAWRSLSGYLA